MKQRVTAYVGKTHYSWDYDDETLAQAWAKEYARTGFSLTSKAGVVTYILPHRISRITRRWVKR